MAEKIHDYRKRIYQYYTSARSRRLAPETVDGFKSRAPYLQKIISEHFPEDKNAHIVDLGCGHGAFIYFIRQAGYSNVIGVDRSPEQVAEAKRLGIEGVREGDLMEFLKDLPGSSQDVVIAFDVIEHFTKDELMPFVDEVYRVLRGGKWIIHMPNGELPFAGRIRYGDFSHEQIFTRVSINQVLKSSAFSEVHCYEDYPVIHGVKSLIRWILWKMIRSVLRLYLAAETGGGWKECILSQNFLTVGIK